MATTTLTLPAAEAIPASAQSFGTAHGTILALDLGTHHGLGAPHRRWRRITSGTVSFRPDRCDGGGVRYLRFRAWLDEYRQRCSAASAWSSITKKFVLTLVPTLPTSMAVWLATLTAWCEQRGVAYQGVPVGTIKRFIAGKGNADKDAVIAAVRARGFAPADDNEADALAILLWAIETAGGVR